MWITEITSLLLNSVFKENVFIVGSSSTDDTGLEAGNGIDI